VAVPDEEELMAEPEPKNDNKTLFGLINAAQSMIDNIGAAGEKKEPEAAAKAPEATATKPQASVLRKMEAERVWLQRNQILEATALRLLTELRSKGLLSDRETIAIKLESDINHQFVSLKTEIEKSLQR
jgi:hypothetical protein